MKMTISIWNRERKNDHGEVPDYAMQEDLAIPPKNENPSHFFQGAYSHNYIFVGIEATLNAENTSRQSSHGWRL